MAWFITAREKKDANQRSMGFWQLVASNSAGLFHIGCDHNHPTQKEAQECEPARREISAHTGVPLERI